MVRRTYQRDGEARLSTPIIPTRFFHHKRRSHQQSTVIPHKHSMFSNQLNTAAIAAIFTSLAPNNVHGHGHLVSPRSRNYVAHQDGVWWPASDTTPYPEDCPHCKYVIASTLFFLPLLCITDMIPLSLKVSTLAAQKHAVAWSIAATTIIPRMQLVVI